ncbi:DNA adenine methylase, partial [Mycoplasmopsis bovis]|uniref:DNA adenine methylase n=1 Tax=Mycoplasmopsis bovis TaxID=28903 RepID=UPI003D2DA7F8
IGGKYKLLNQIVRYFPKNIDTFYDLFAGGCDVAINIKANKIVVNDINDSLINLYRFIYETELEKLIEQIQKVIVDFFQSNWGVRSIIFITILWCVRKFIFNNNFL